MYESYFGLTERPFSIAPDPHYLYMSSRHKEAMAHLSYGLSQGGCFIVLSGEVGTGKTTLCRNLLSDLPSNVDVALVLNANINETELLQTVCDELKIEYSESQSQKQLLDLINTHLLATFADNRHTVLIIDEAQLLSRNVLEQIRLLTNLETTKSKLLQIILIGQPELNDVLSRNDLRQLSQRVTARYHLGALERSEIEEYVNYRLGVAGCKQPLFSRQALNKMHALTDGIPRRINVLADHALLSAYSQTKSLVDAKTVKKAATDVFIRTASSERSAGKATRWWLLASLLLMVNLAGWWYFSQDQAGSVTGPIVDTIKQVSPTIDSSAEVSAADTQIGPRSAARDSAPTVELPELSGQTESLPLAVSSDSLVTQISVSGSSEGDAPGSVQISDQPLSFDEPIEQSSAAYSVNASETVIPAPAVVVAPRIDEETSFGRVLEVSPDLTGQAVAYRRLATEWESLLPSQLIQPICQTIKAQNLRCLSVTTWRQIKSFNRPVIIVVQHQSQLHRVIIRSINGDVATVLIGDTIHRVPMAELKARWVNDGLVFWRPSAAGASLQQFGNAGAVISKLRLQLNRALARAELPLLTNIDSLEFDLDMSQKVFAMQVRFDLISDSKVGNETYLIMNELVSPELTPVLTQRVP